MHQQKGVEGGWVTGLEALAAPHMPVPRCDYEAWGPGVLALTF